MASSKNPDIPGVWKKRVGGLVFLMMLSCFSGCASKAVFYGPEPFPSWMKEALIHPEKSDSHRRFASAFHGNREALHACFMEALKQANSNEIDCEGGEALAFELRTIVQRIGDRRFATALALETPETQSAVSLFTDQRTWSNLPRTNRVLDKAPKIDFPLTRAYEATLQQ